MKIAEPDSSTIQPGIYKLAVHVLGHRDDAADATQEILLKVVTHLAGFRGESAFSTWVWRLPRRWPKTPQGRHHSVRRTSWKRARWHWPAPSRC